MNKHQIAFAELERVAALVIPPIRPERILTDNSRREADLIPTLRGFVGLGLMRAGFRKVDVANLFRVPWETADTQMRRCLNRAQEPRFSNILTK